MLKKKILVIDDSYLYTYKIKSVLDEAGFIVTAIDNGVDGLRLAREINPDLILLDVIMPGMNGFEVCRALRSSEYCSMTPIIILTSSDHQDDVIYGLELGADDYITKPFYDKELIIRVGNTLRRIERLRNANPLTGLPGNRDVVREIESRIESDCEFSVIYADIDNFKAYNDVYGFANGDRAIKLTADIIREQLARLGDKTTFIGHVGGDDFIVIINPQHSAQAAAGITSEFDSRITELYNKSDLIRGSIISVSRQGTEVQYPIMTISLAIVTNVFRHFTSYLQVAEAAAEVKKKVKSFEGSNYFIDRRRA